MVACGLPCAQADTIQLKDKAAITGKILAEKPDHIAVDIGYTVLVIPRSQVVAIVKDDTPAPASKRLRGSKAVATATNTAEIAEARHGVYVASIKSPPVRTVLELVNQIGEAVVQVRTPSGLGSGFFLNEDGFLITNFHVVEGETQISVEVYHQKDGRIEAHIMVCFLAYCVHVTLRAKLQRHAPGLTPRQVLDHLGKMQMIDVRLPATDGRELLP